ncbi:MAG: winged helix-turn-helix transcriptional regulator [Candidatus Sungbacteria bacterium]|uniref:Winged helix-turn-helix transcriptional regulator n=1 Tax=Candidatus Sungiibacteriota bacterium TaxID=2750080 RepID=A0A9D6LTJ9_9BACT|nr:winged helix-turn-helix transcriptional regulator [Candidatus Sungbacteria bacterium]
MKMFKELETITKGYSNHRRIEIMALLERVPGLTLQQTSENLGINFKTVSDHLRRLAIAGLVSKRNRGAAVEHTLTSRGKLILKFLRTLE